MKTLAMRFCLRLVSWARPSLRQVAIAGPVLAAATIAGCAAPADTQADGDAGAAAQTRAEASAAAPSVPHIMVSPSSVGTWYDLGEHLAPWLSGDVPVAAAVDTVPTRVAGLRRSDGRWLAVVLLQENHGAGAICPPVNSLHVASDRAEDCIRLRRDADHDRWLQQQHPVLYSWVQRHGWAAQPRAWISSRVPGQWRALEANVLVDPALIEATTRSNTDFLEAGRPGFAWARQFAAATQAAAAGSALRVPPFPFAAQVAPQPPSVQSMPAQAEQVTPESAEPPAVRPPRQDRQ
ncbi:MAG: hypothetical protein WCZ18_04930 [Ottowia sp.]|nr:hypothetical protein [Ottowia sp.]